MGKLGEPKFSAEGGHDCYASTNWYEQAPDFLHRFKVKCAVCQKFLKWGTEDQVEALHNAGKSYDIVKYKAPKSIF